MKKKEIRFPQAIEERLAGKEVVEITEHHVSGDLVYRQAETADLDGVVSMITQAIIQMINQGIDQWDERYPTKKDFEQDISCGQLTVGTSGGEIAVIYTVNREYEPEYESACWKSPGRPFCILHRLCVNPVFQNQGIARKTMEHIEREAAARGIEAIRLDVFSRNPYALKLYQNCGFERVGKAEWRKGLFYLMEKYLL